MADISTNLAAASLVFSVLSFIVLTITLVMWHFPVFGESIRSVFNLKSAGSEGFSSNFSLVAVLLGAFSPDISLLIGFVSDIVNGSFRYSVTSLVGVFAVIIHYAFGRMFGFKPTETIDYISAGKPSTPVSTQTAGSYIQDKFNPCTIRGLGMFEVTNSPMGMAALSSMFVVYLVDMINKRSTAQVGIYLGFSAAILMLNLYTYKEAACIKDTSIMGLIRGIALPTIVGLTSGGIAYGVMKTYYPDSLPLDAEPFDGTPGKKHITCSKPSENEFVCDAYKDGKKISTSIVS